MECDVYDVDNDVVLTEYRSGTKNPNIAHDQSNAVEGYPAGHFRSVPNGQPHPHPHFYSLPFGPRVIPASSQPRMHQMHATAVHAPTVIQTDFGPALLLRPTGAPSIALATPSHVRTPGFPTGPPPTGPPHHGHTNPLPSSSTTTRSPTNSSLITKAALEPSASDVSTRFQRWTEDEDQVLLHATKQEGGPPYNWSRVAAKYFPTSRTGPQCKARWKKALKPGLKRGQWEPEEDRLILELHERGLKWTEIAQHLPGRVPDHIHQRFMNSLDPNKKKTPWTEDEKKVLYEAQKRLGNKWSEIAKLLPGRSENDAKNRWHNAKMAQRRKLRRLTKESARLTFVEKNTSLSDSNPSIRTEHYDAINGMSFENAALPTETDMDDGSRLSDD